MKLFIEENPWTVSDKTSRHVDHDSCSRSLAGCQGNSNQGYYHEDWADRNDPRRFRRSTPRALWDREVSIVPCQVKERIFGGAVNLTFAKSRKLPGSRGGYPLPFTVVSLPESCSYIVHLIAFLLCIFKPISYVLNHTHAIQTQAENTKPKESYSCIFGSKCRISNDM